MARVVLSGTASSYSGHQALRLLVNSPRTQRFPYRVCFSRRLSCSTGPTLRTCSWMRQMRPKTRDTSSTHRQRIRWARSSSPGCRIARFSRRCTTAGRRASCHSICLPNSVANGRPRVRASARILFAWSPMRRSRSNRTRRRSSFMWSTARASLRKASLRSGLPRGGA
jgi:hypothetical protein